MTPSDELWIEMSQFDTNLADAIWDGTAVPDVAPPWYGEVATLIRAAKAPALPDELVAEDDIVARMQAAILEAQASGAPEVEPAPDHEPDHEPAVPATVVSITSAPSSAVPDDGDADDPDPNDADADERTGRGGRVIRRVVAVKAVAATTAFAIGITAAAATTGLVTVVVPAARDRLLPTDKSPSQVVEHDGPSGGPSSGDDGSDDGPGLSTTEAPGGPGAGTPQRSERSGTEAEAGDATTTPSSQGDGTAVDPTGDSATTTVPDGSSAPPDETPADPPPTETTVTTESTTTTTTTTTTITPMSVPEPDPGAQAASAELVETLAAGPTSEAVEASPDTADPLGPTVTDG